MSKKPLALLAGGAVTVAAVGAVIWAAGPAGAATISPFDIAGRGAVVPFVEQEAEKAATNGTSTGTSRYYGQLSSEASGREAITLDAVGEYVEFTLTKPANAMSFRYSMADDSTGAGRNATLQVSSGSVTKTVPVTSKYAWQYGSYPFNGRPGEANPHHFYDETRLMFGTTLNTGAKVKIQVTSTAQAPAFTIDLADFENVPAPIAKPSGALDVVADFGADPSGGSADNTAKFQAAVDAGKAQGKPVYIPQGNYTLYDHVVVDGVTLQGAGPWYSVLGGRDPVNRNRAAGVYGKYVSGGGYTGQIRPQEAGGPSKNVTLKDFAIIGDVSDRIDDDQVNALGGAMSNSTVDNLWLQHTKVGAWMDGPMDNFTIKNSRILDQTADGVNFHWGVTNSAVTNTFVRNTGDDGLAMWAQNVPNVKNSFTHNTVVAPVLANNLVSYGGQDINISDNVVSETVSNGGGIHVGNRYTGVTGPTIVKGTWTLARNTLIRAGNSDYNWNFGVGAIWFWGEQAPLTGATINITDTDILDSSYSALMWTGNPTDGLHFSNVNIQGAGTYAMQVASPVSASFANVKVSGIAQNPPIYNCVGNQFAVTDGGGNTGWSTGSTYCGPWPTPVWGTGSTTTPPTTPTSDPTTTPPTTTPPANGNLAQGKTVAVSSANSPYVGSNAVDGNAATYWESANNAFPQTYTVDLGSSQSVGRLVLKLPTGWESRQETVAVSGSTDGSSFSSLVGATAYTLNPSATISLPSGNKRFLRLTISANTGWPAAQLAEVEAYADGGTTPTTPPVTNGNLTAGRPVTATSQADVYTPANVVDGNANTYWESANNAFPQSLTVDLGAAKSVGKVVLKLPPASAWATRTETLSVLGSTDGSAFNSLKASGGVTFNPATGNAATITFGASSQRYLRLTFTGNTGWPAGQISEFEAYAS